MKLKSAAEEERVMRSSWFYIGAVIAAIITVLVLIGIFWTPYGPTAMDGQAKMQAPSWAHLMGTDKFGRDIFSRILKGAGTSFMVSFAVVMIGGLFGTVIGAFCGYFGGVADAVLTRICDTITAFPAVLLALVVISVVGGGSFNIILVLGILFIPSFARIARAEFARTRNADYVQSARLMGAGNMRIMFCHILPNTFSVLLPTLTIGFNNAILSEASMSFLGIGITPPGISLGLMLNDAQTCIGNAPWYALSTGFTIVLIILGFSFLSEGLQQSARRS